jgi:hypothetical protein
VTIFFANKGKMPNNTNDPNNAGDKIPAKESIFAN